LLNSYFAFHRLLLLATQFANSQKSKILSAAIAKLSDNWRIEAPLWRSDNERVNLLKLLFRTGGMAKTQSLPSMGWLHVGAQCRWRKSGAVLD
jgi:hypothetical protein